MDHESGVTDEYPGNDVRGDEGDVAAKYAALHNQDAIERVLAEDRRPAGPGAEVCEWCEAEIPEARRQAQPGCTLCVDCQSCKERLKGGM